MRQPRVMQVIDADQGIICFYGLTDRVIQRLPAVLQKATPVVRKQILSELGVGCEDRGRRSLNQQELADFREWVDELIRRYE